MTPVRPLIATLGLSMTLLAACSSGSDVQTTPTRSPEPDVTSSTPTTEESTRAVPQRAQLLMHPQLAQPGVDALPAADALSSMTAVFRPAREGREVDLQVKQDGAWGTTATEPQDKEGVVEFNAPYQVRGEVATYRVSAPGDDELPEKVSPPVRTDPWGEPDLSDEFAGGELGGNWSHRLQGYQPESSRECSKADPRAATVSGGTVRLSVLADPDRRGSACNTEDGTYDYRLNGHISTEDTRSFTYGTFAARIKFQPRRGQHGAFWMQPASQVASVGDPVDTGAEIDVIEWFGNNQPQGGLTSFLYYKPDAEGEKVGGFIKSPEQYGDAWASEYHVFSVEWTPDHYVFRIDGQETFRTSEGVSGRPEFLILSVLSSDYELPFLGPVDRLPQHMYVDWIRHWKNSP